MLRSGNLHRNRNFTPETISDLTDREFQKTFRMPRFSFRKLLRLVHRDLEVDAVQAFRGSGSMISPSTRLLLTLRYLAGGAYNDLTDYSGVGRGYFSSDKTSGPLWNTVHALNNCPEL